MFVYWISVLHGLLVRFASETEIFAQPMLAAEIGHSLRRRL